MNAWKVLTHDGRSPIQGGEPIYRGEPLPHPLPTVRLDIGQDECAAGWNACLDPTTALRIAGLWRSGFPATLWRVQLGADAITRGNKSRSSTCTLIAPASTDEMRGAVRGLYTPWAGDLTDALTEETGAWRLALMRPSRDPEAVASHLEAALRHRGLRWTVRHFPSPQDAWTARDAWNAWNAWTARDAWAAWTARDAGAAWTAGAARDAWNAWTAWNARDARDAWNALILYVAVRRGWLTTYPADYLTVGIREAYACGAAIVIPTGPTEIGYALRVEDDDVDREGA